MPRIARAIAWKEWRTQRPVVLAGLGISLAMPLFIVAGLLAMRREIGIVDLADGTSLVIALVVWPLMAAACGATTIASEIGDGTLGFLLSRPVSRARVWVLKVAAGASSLALIIAGSFLVIALFRWFAEERVVGAFLPDDLVMPALAGMALALAIFPASVFFSTFIGRTMTAAAAGVVAALTLLAGVTIVWFRMDLQPRLEPTLFVAEIALTAALCLLASFYVFSRGEMLRGARARRSVAVGLLMIVSGLMLVGVPIIYAQMRLGPGSAILSSPQASPDGSSLAVTASTLEGNSPQVWLIHTDGSGFERLTSRLAYTPAFSPDGRRVAYLSSRGLFGLKSNRQSLHVVTTDDGDDRVLIEDLPYRMEGTEVLFSPDGGTVALKSGGDLYAVAASGGPPAVLHLRGTPLERARLAGWRPDGGEVVVTVATWGDDAEITVAACDPRTGSVRTVYTAAAAPWMFLNEIEPGRHAGIDHLPVLIQRPGPRGLPISSLVLVDLTDGSTRTIADHFSGVTDLSPDGDMLAYGDASELRIVDLREMRTRTVARMEETASRILLSPSADRVLVQQRGHDGRALPLVIFDLLGAPTELPDGWSIPIGWSGRNRVIVGRDDPSGFTRRLALADADTGELHEIYPGKGIIQPEGARITLKER